MGGADIVSSAQAAHTAALQARELAARKQTLSVLDFLPITSLHFLDSPSFFLFCFFFFFFYLLCSSLFNGKTSLKSPDYPRVFSTKKLRFAKRSFHFLDLPAIQPEP